MSDTTQGQIADAEAESANASANDGDKVTFSKEEFEAALDERTGGLKAKVDQLLAEKKREQAEKEAAQKEAKAIEEAKLKESEDWQKLASLNEEKAKGLEAQLLEMQQKASREKLESEALRIASEVSPTPALILPHILSRIDIENGVVSANDYASIDELKTAINTDPQFLPLVFGNKSVGGGAAGSKSTGGAGGNKSTAEIFYGNS